MKDKYRLLNNEKSQFDRYEEVETDNEKMKNIMKSKLKSHKQKKLPKVAAACLIGVIALGTVNPALASRIPFIGNVFESIEKNINFPGEYSQYSTSVNETAYSNGIGITIDEVICDGQYLYATFIVENEKPFPYTSLETGEDLDMNQLIIEEKYNKLDFTNKEPNTRGLTGLEGKFIDEHTFIGVRRYDLSNIKEEIPDEFNFKTKIIAVNNYSPNANKKDSIKLGTWSFDIPVKVNKELKQEINIENIENDYIKIESVSLTPFEMKVTANYKQGNWFDYEMSVYDKNGKQLFSDTVLADEDKKEIYKYLSSPEDKNEIRIVIDKVTWEELPNEPESLAEVGRELVFDEVIKLKK